MPVEASVEVVSEDAHGVEVRALSACAGCGGCGGRCGLGFSAARAVRLPRALIGYGMHPGDRLRLLCEATALRDRALIGYGLPLLMLLLGGLLGAVLASVLALASNPAVALGAGAGTLLGLGLSKRSIRGAGDLRLLEVRPDLAPPSVGAPAAT